MTLRIREYRLGLFAPLWLAHVALVWHLWFIVDDAFISFRFARNFVLGHGLRYNLGEHAPVEGYSNFLWVMVCAGLEWLGLDPRVWPLVVSAACGSVLLWLVFDRLHRRLELPTVAVVFGTLAVGCYPALAAWCSGGLATMPFALLVFLTFDRLVLAKDRPAGVAAGIAGLALALIRLEGVAWCVVLLVLAIVSRRLARERCARQLATFALIVGLGYAAYFGWRYSYFGMLLPNTAYAKAELDWPRLLRGAKYVASHALLFILPAIILPGLLVALRKRRLAVGLAVAAMAWAFPAYAVVVTGDWMPMGRFLVPGVAFTAILLAWVVGDLWRWSRGGRVAGVVIGSGLLACALLPAFNYSLIPNGVLERLQYRHGSVLSRGATEYERLRARDEALRSRTLMGYALRDYAVMHGRDPATVSIELAAIGVVGYYSDLYIYDKQGLVTPEVAHRELDPNDPMTTAGHDKGVGFGYFLRYNVDLLQADVIQRGSPREVALACRKSAARLRGFYKPEHPVNRYVAEVMRVRDTLTAGRPAYLIVWRRVPDGVEMSAAWAEFDRRIGTLQSGRDLDPPGSSDASDAGRR